MQLQCAERIPPELQAVTHGSNGASFNLWSASPEKRKFSVMKKMFNSKIFMGFHGLIRSLMKTIV